MAASLSVALLLLSASFAPIGVSAQSRAEDALFNADAELSEPPKVTWLSPPKGHVKGGTVVRLSGDVPFSRGIGSCPSTWVHCARTWRPASNVCTPAWTSAEKEFVSFLEVLCARQVITFTSRRHVS